jgi:hypothetical protein
MKKLKPSTLSKYLKLLTWNKTLKCWTFNIPAGTTCEGASLWCAKYCYAKKGNWRYKNVKKQSNRKLTITLNPPEFMKRLSFELDKISANGYNIVRIHSSGDFYSVDYFRTWLDIARNHKNITFFCYTKQWRIKGWYEILKEASRINNFHVMCSYDNTMDSRPRRWMRIASISDDWNKVTCKKQLDKSESCATCKICFDPKEKRVVFYPH